MQIRILSGGAAKGLVDTLLPALMARHGASVGGQFGAVGAMCDLLRAGAPADLLILTRKMIADLEASGEVVHGTVVDIGSVATAIAVRRGDPLPLVGNSDQFRAMLVEASEIYFPDPTLATAGIHVAKTLASLGLDCKLTSRLRTFPNGAAAMEALARSAGPQPIGLTQASEILSTPGVTLVASMPAPHAMETVYTAAVATRATAADLARAFAALLAAPDALTHRAAAGFA